MRVIIDKGDGVVISIVSNSETPQQLKKNELEIETEDPKLTEAFNSGYEILYNKATGQLYYDPPNEIDPEKAVLYEAVANLFEEVQMLKAQIGGER